MVELRVEGKDSYIAISFSTENTEKRKNPFLKEYNKCSIEIGPYFPWSIYLAHLSNYKVGHQPMSLFRTTPVARYICDSKACHK